MKEFRNAKITMVNGETFDYGYIYCNNENQIIDMFFNTKKRPVPFIIESKRDKKTTIINTKYIVSIEYEEEEDEEVDE